MRVVVLVALALAGCQSVEPPRPTLVGCPFEGPEHVVEATTPEAQRWANITIETGVRVCDWDRPK